MEMQEMSRIITGLRSSGVTDKEIVDLLLYIGTGEEKYKHKKENEEVPE